MSTTQKILFVCTGNICRSPAAEAILRAKAVDHRIHGGLFVDSAGTDAFHVGEAPTNKSVLIAGRRGYDLAQLKARQVSVEDFDTFDQIICMTRDHKHILEQRFGLANLQTKAKLRLFSDLAGPGLLPTDIPDPWSMPSKAYEDMYDLIEIGIDAFIPALKDLPVS